MDVDQFQDCIVQPALLHLRLWSPAAHQQVLGTAVQESAGLRYIKQLGRGPALGVCQMEPATHDSLYANYLVYNPHLLALLKEIEPSGSSQAMMWNLRYSVAMCRIHYRAIKEALPNEGDINGQASYWKRHYNTAAGKGTVEQYIQHWNEHVRKIAEVG